MTITAAETPIRRCRRQIGVSLAPPWSGLPSAHAARGVVRESMASDHEHETGEDEMLLPGMPRLGGFFAGLTWGLPGQAGWLPGQARRLPGQAGWLRGHTRRPIGQTAGLPGHTRRLIGQTRFILEQTRLRPRADTLHSPMMERGCSTMERSFSGSDRGCPAMKACLLRDEGGSARGWRLHPPAIKRGCSGMEACLPEDEARLLEDEAASARGWRASSSGRAPLSISMRSVSRP